MSHSGRKGFTLVELVIVIAVIVVVIALLLPATRRVGEASNRVQCANNLKQLMLAMHTYCDSTGTLSSLPSRGRLDAAAEQVFPPGCIGPGTTPEERLSWVVALLPYMEQNHLYQQFDLEKGYERNLPAAQTKIELFICPSSKGSATSGAVTEKGTATGDAATNYVAMAGIGHDAARQPAGAAGNGFMGYDRLTSLNMIKDGISNTIAVMETRFDLGPWARGGSSTLRGFDPADISLPDNRWPLSAHPGGMQAGLADGSVRFISSSITLTTLAAAITIAGGEPLGSDW